MQIEGQIELVAATSEQQPILANLIELYAYDFSEFSAVRIQADGRFGYPLLPLYWQEPNRFPFLVKVDGNLAGLALIKQGSEISGDLHIWDVAEFFIMRGYRKHGVGRQVAHQIWRKFPGRWEVRVTPRNLDGQSFWQRAISSFIGVEIEADLVNRGEKSWFVFSFNTTLAKPNPPTLHN